MRNSNKSPFPTALCVTAKGLNLLSAAAIGAIVLLINFDVFSRFFFANPIRGVVELVALSIPATLFLSLAAVKLQNRLIRADVLANKLAASAPALSNALQIFFIGIAIAIAAAIVAASVPEFMHSVQFGIYRGVAGEFAVPVWPLQGIVLLGSTLLLVCEVISLKSVSASRRVFGTLVVIIALLGLVSSSLESRHSVGGFAIGLMFVLIYLGLPVAYALMAAAAFGIAIIKTNVGISVEALGLIATGAVGEYVFAAVPLFVLLGIVVGAANIGRDALQSVHWVLGRLVGGLATSTVFANAVFAAITGISIASAAIFSRIAVPPLIEQGYQARFAVGLIAGSSVLGMLIPPSLLLIIYGLVAEVSINALFTAAIIPGIVLTGAFIVFVTIIAITKPSFAVQTTFSSHARQLITAGEALLKAIPIGILILVTLGGIYGGVFTPTEAGAVGALAALLLSLVMKRLRAADLLELFVDAAQSSASILSLILGASAFAVMLTLSGIPSALGVWIADAGMGLVAYTMVYLLVLVILGTVLDSTSILLIMLPLALPTVVGLNGDLIWFGIVTVIGVEIGLLTPPLGLSVFTIKSALDNDAISLTDIFAGAFPFVLIMLLVSLLLIAFPEISLYLVK